MINQPDISDEAVLQATGRAWREWLDLLGGADMASRTHEELVVFLREDHGVPAWWQQAIANQFEQSIGKQSAHETDDGFQASVSCTLEMTVAAVFAAWTDETLRANWLRRGDFEPTTVREPDTVRGKWMPDGSRVDVDIAEAGEGRCALTIGHRRLASDEAAERMRQFWKLSVDRLVERLGGAK